MPGSSSTTSTSSDSVARWGAVAGVTARCAVVLSSVHCGISAPRDSLTDGADDVVFCIQSVSFGCAKRYTPFSGSDRGLLLLFACPCWRLLLQVSAHRAPRSRAKPLFARRYHVLYHVARVRSCPQRFRSLLSKTIKHRPREAAAQRTAVDDRSDQVRARVPACARPPASQSVSQQVSAWRSLSGWIVTWSMANRRVRT